MYTSFIRTVILYLTLTALMRIMGKRQIGQLQPGELVITILISEIAAIPMQDNDIPLINTFISIFLLASLEILISDFSLKSIRFRSVAQGNSLLIIRNGKLDQQQIKRLRYSVDDILEALRKKNVFDISDVQYAVAETDGSISVMLKQEKLPATKSDAKAQLTDDGIPCVVISDRKIIETNFKDCGLSREQLDRILKKEKIDPEKTLLMTVTKSGKLNVIKKEDKK